MPRFFVTALPQPGSTTALTGENAAHAKVLRLRPGESLTLCDGRGMECDCVLQPDGLLLAGPSRTGAGEPAVAVTVYMALAKADKLEHVIQKATELGAAEIVAFPTERCVSRPDGKSLEKKLERWQKIAASAAEQSRRGRIPVVRALDSCRAALAEAAGAELPVLFYENEHARTFSAAIGAGPFQTAALITGPEGGFDPREVELAEGLGIRICTLGSRILRCETAPLCALSALMYAVGEF